MFISVIFITAKTGDESNVRELREHGELTEWTSPAVVKDQQVSRFTCETGNSKEGQNVTAYRHSRTTLQAWTVCFHFCSPGR